MVLHIYSSLSTEISLDITSEPPCRHHHVEQHYITAARTLITPLNMQDVIVKPGESDKNTFVSFFNNRMC